MRRGRKSAAQTPALKSERIYGSKKNPKGSASSEKSAKQITLSEKTMKALQNKLAEFKKSHTNKNITLNDLKAVYRRGSGAFSSSHRPNIPRNAWAMARVNKFLKKASGQKVKAAYVQDDDLMKYEDGGQVNEIILIRGEGKNTTGSVDLFGRGLYLTDSLSVAKFYGDNIKTYKIKGKIFDTSKPMSPKEFRKFCKTFDKTFNTYLGNKLLNGLIEFNDGKLPSETYDYTQISWSFDSWSEFYELLKENKLNTNEQNSYANTNTAINMALKNMGYVGLKYSTNEVEDLEENGLSGLNAFVIFDKNSIEEINNYEGGGEIGVTAKVYRGTGERVNETYGGRTDEGLGVFYTDNETMAKWFAGLIEYDVDTERYEPTGEKGKIESSTIELKNPYIIDSTHEDYDIDNQHTSWNILMEEINAKDKKEVESFVSKLVSKGYDGIVLKDNTTNYYEDGTYDIYVKFTPEQLGNSNLDIKFDDGGFIDDKMELYHGGNLDEYNDIIAQKNGRYEYGAGLYLTTHQDTARKYAKGSRKLYKITVEKGVDIHDATISVDNVNAFIKKYVISSKRKEISQRLEKWNDNGTVKANIFNNVILNEKGISASNTKNLRTFLVDNGIDYEIVDNPFGWGETMIVLYNMAKIIKVEKLDKSIYANGGLIAPNGKKSNLTAEQYKLVRTPQFKKWFGDWENNPESASKVVDENGEPLVVYHGTKNIFFEFDTNKQIKGWLGRGFYFTKNKIEAKDYGNRLLKCFLNIRNLFIVEDDKVNEDGSVTFALNVKEQISQKYGSLNNAEISITLKNNANDGIVYGDMISCFYSNQIKLADGTNTTFDTNNSDIRFDDGGLIAPNGKKSNLTAEQYELVRTPQFKKWFGDWENNPESASKVVDENGEPMVVYHGTRNRFDVFDIDKSGESNTLAKVGFWFTPLSKFAYNFADNSWWGKNNAFVYPVFLSIKNPKIFVSEDIIYGDSYQKYRTEVYKVAGQTEEDANTGGLGMMLNNPKETIKKYRELLSDEGYDGIIIKNTRFDKSEAGGYNDQYIALQPNQIKLAYGNTTFDSNNPNMRFAKGGKTNSMKKKGIEARGDCYYIAGQFAMDNIFTPKKIEYIGTPYLVHGEVQGQGAVSHIRYGHAWIEDDENVYDFSNGRELVIPKVVYYAIGDINPDEPTKYKKYTFAEARRKMVNTGHYGCWDLDVEYKEGGELYAESMKKYDNGGGIPSNLTNVRNSRLFIPDVRGGWTKEKIVKYFKNKLSDSISTFRLTKYISQFENWEQFKNHIYYHGTQGYIESGLKPSITMSEREAERSGGGGYGQRYYGISLTKRKRTAESFSGMSSGVTIYPVILKKDAKVIERTDLTDAADIEDIIVELYEQGIDAVWIGGGEEELVVVNPYSVLIYKDGKEYHRSYGGFKSIPLTDEKIKDIYETSKILWEEYSEEYKEKQNQEEKQSFLKSLPNIQFEKGGLIAPNGNPSNLTPEQYKLVRTPEFKAWFGDWENDLENSSKVVDENGEPLVVWHYSKRLQYELDKFYVFNVDRQIGSHFGTIKQAQNLKYIPSGQSEVKTSNKEISDFRYYQVFLNIKNPIRLKDVGIFDEKTLIEAINDIEQLKDYDWEYINNYSRKSTDSLLDRVKHIAKGKGIDGAVYLNRYESDAESSYISSLDEVSDKVFKKNIPSAEDSWIAFYPEQIKLADGTNTTFDSSNDIRYKKGGRVWNDDELLKRYKRGESIGFSGIAHLKAQGLIKRADGTKRKTMADGAEVLTTAEKDLFDIYDIQTILKLQKTSFKNGGSTENLKIILVPETYQKMKTDLAALKGIGNPRIAMLDDNHNVMGGVFINEDEYECNFDIRLKDEHRHKGYNCLLIKALIKDFHDNMDVEMLVCENDFTQKLGWENGCFTRTNAKDFMRQNKHKYINYLHTDSPKIMDEFNASNQDENQDITCVGCSWNWNTSQSDKSDKYVCHQCGFDNTLFYDKNIMNRLKKPMSVPEISTKHNANEEYVLEQLQKGMKHEMEHTDDEQIAEIIALHHIGERPDYYEVLETMKLAKGGDVLEVEQEIMEYDIPEYIQSEKEFAKQVMNSDETRISRAMICKAKIDNALQNEMQVENPEEKNAWAEVNDIWKKCFYEIMSEDFHEHEEEQCGCGCQTTTYKKGGECGCDDTPTYNKGGLAYGNSHDKGGMPLTVESTGQDIEIEGGEGVINKRSMQMNKKLEFEGKEMTPCEIISKINEMGGGVKFKCADVKKIIAEDGNFD